MMINNNNLLLIYNLLHHYYLVVEEEEEDDCYTIRQDSHHPVLRGWDARLTRPQSWNKNPTLLYREGHPADSLPG